MPMTQAKAQELLSTYKEVLNTVKTRLNSLDAANPNVADFISNLLEALELIANPSNASDDPYRIKAAQTVLASSVTQKQGLPQTTLEYLDSKYMSQDVDEKGYVVKAFIKLQDEIREGLNAELVVDVSSVITTAEGEPEGISANVSVTSSITSEGGSESKDNDEALVEEINWALWLQRGALGVCFVASLAACVAAVMTANPVLLGVGVVATAVSGFALTQSFGFFSNHSDNLEENMTRSVESTPAV